MVFSIFLVLLKLSVVVNSYNYLVINPIFGFSNVKFMTKIADTLADNGHNVTLFQPFHLPLKNLEGLAKNKNVEIINFYPSNFEKLKNSQEQAFPFLWDSRMVSSPAMNALMFPSIFIEDLRITATAGVYSEVLRDNSLFDLLKSKKFDAVVGEFFEISGLYLAHRLQIPSFIGTMSAVRFLDAETLFGQGPTIGYVPAPGSKLGNEAGFMDRLNDVYTFLSDNIFLNRLMGMQQEICQEALGENVKIPHWKELFTKCTKYVTNSNPYLDFAVPNIGSVIQIGGFTMDPSTKKSRKIINLPDEYDQIMNERKHTVLISFGSVIRSYQMPDNFKSGIIEAMKNLPDITFIWKYEKDDDLEFKKRLSPNVYLKKWIPQEAILADPRLSLFVTHGGLGSTMEVAYSGIAALMVPIFGDQPYNAMMLARHGGAVNYDKFELANGEKLRKTIEKMTQNPVYKRKAVELKNILQNQPIDPKQLLVKNLEFAVQFPNLKSQVPEIRSAGWIGYYYIDIFIFFAALFILSIYVPVKIAIIVFDVMTRSLRKSGVKTKSE